MQQIIISLAPHLKYLITHEYANYSLQRLFNVCTPKQRLLILSELQTNIMEIAKNKQGTYTIQTFITSFTQ